MKLTKKLEAEILKLYSAYWDAYLKGDMKTFASMLDDNITVFGTAVSEVFNNKKETVRFYKATSDQMTGKAEFRNRQIRMQPVDNTIAINEQNDLYVLIEKEWTYYGHARVTAIFQQAAGVWKLVHQHASFPDSKAEEGEQISPEKIKAENIELREAVKRRTIELEQKNRDLEIETALERVRAVAMGMKEPADMLDVCRIISHQLQSLGVKEIRNLQTAIFYESKGIYLNYEFFALHDKTVITEVEYNLQPDVKAFVSQMQQDPEAFFTREFKGTKLKKWIEYQIKSNQFVDPHLYEVKSLHYYFYSIGPGALGISTYAPLKDNELAVFKRFRNVFELAYRRFIDIEKAEAQSREAQIELALERVRARAMAMQNSDELSGLVATLFEELIKLNLILYRCIIWIFDPDTSASRIWMANSEEKKGAESYFINKLDHPYYDAILKGWKEKNLKWVYDLHGKDKKSIDKLLLTETELTQLPEPVKAGILSSKHTIVSGSFNNFGLIEASGPVQQTDEQLEILSRFGKVFDQTYTRFLDLQKAETQAREAKIEAALERVRARAMGMRHSDELSEVLSVLFTQFDVLGISPMYTFLSLIDQEKNRFIYRQTGRGGKRVIAQQIIDLDALDVWKEVVERWKVGTYDTIETMYIPKESVHKTFEVFGEIYSALPEGAKVYPEDFPDGMYTTIGTSKFGHLGYDHFRSSGEDEKSILLKFNTEFVRLYQRFLDLQKAEAQAREAKIEAALERTRTQSMLMQHSKELDITSRVFHEQLLLLGIPSEFSYVWLPDVEKEKHFFWAAWDEEQDGSNVLQSKSATYDLDRTEPYTAECFIAWESGEPVHVYPIAPAEVKNFFDIWGEIMGDAKKLKPGFFPEGLYYAEAFMKYGCFGIYIRRLLTEDEKKILLRFTIEFERTYTRFLDLQKAEAQAREAQIEAGLERVRSRAMAMHKTDELLDAAELIHKELSALGITSMNVSYAFVDEDEKYGSYYSVNPVDGKVVPFPFVFPHTETEVMRSILSSWRKQEPFQVIELDEEATLKHQTYIGEHILQLITKSNSDIPFSLEAFLAVSPKKAVIYTFNFTKGYLFNIGSVRLTNEQEEMLLRFTKVFEMTYRRFLDLKQAEAQARESQIELALERVRARTMGMQKSEELKEVIQVVFEQFVHLKIHVEHTGFIMDYKTRDDMHIWLADKHAVPFQVAIPYFDCAHWNSFIEAKDKGMDFFANHLSFEEKNRFYQDLFKLIPGVPEEALEYYFSCPGLAISTVLLENVGLYIENFSGVPYTDEENNTLMRFGKVFQQTYTRFLDLQKAEAQARESQIEASLERVRAKAMAMHKSEDLNAAVATVFEELDKLNLGLIRCGIAILDKEQPRADIWITIKSDKGKTIQVSGDEPMDIHPLLYNAYKGWLKQEDRSYVLQGEDLVSYYQALGKTNFKQAISASINIEKKDQRQFHFNAVFHDGALFAFLNTDFTDEAKSVMKRFANVFNLTYKRFLDLQNAEAQAREAQIEAALEKVRSRSLAMHKSEELSELVAVLYEKLNGLGVISDGININIIKEGTKNFESWLAAPGQSYALCFHVNYFKHPVTDEIFEAIETGKELLTKVYSFEEKTSFFNYLYNNTDFRNLPEERKKMVLDSKNWEVSIAFAKNTALSLHSYSGKIFSNSENEILKRFAKVFEQSYTRFLDLKKAEAQARESQIEAALERVRSKAMAMQKTEDLANAVGIVFEELDKLEMGTIRCGISIINKEKRSTNIWSTIKSEKGTTVQVTGAESMDIHPLLQGAYDAWLKQEEYSYLLQAEDLDRFYRALAATNFKLPDLPEETQTPKQFMYVAHFPAGGLYVFREKEFPAEAKAVIKRFADVFNLTYTRFNDLQQAEAQAREARIESALDRVRAKAMAMHSSDDLAETIKVFYHQLGLLNQLPRRCGVGLIDKETHLADITGMIISEQGEAKEIAGKLKLAEHPVLKSLYDNWLLQKEYHPVLRGNEIKEYFQLLGSQISFPNYPHDAVQFGYFFFFPEGVVYAWSEKEFADDELKIFRRFTTVLSLTYRRYKDLKEAEAQAREAKIEAAMEKVRARAMAMQKPEELTEVAQVLRREMGLLGVEELETSSIYIHDEASGTTECWYAIQDIRGQDKKLVTDHMNIRLNDTWVGREMMKFYTSGQKQISILMQGENRKEWINYCAQHSKVFQGYYGDTIPERTYHLLKFSNGYMGAASPGEISAESWELLKRATTVFSLAYTRFSDLQLAEANAKEAIKQSALDRVRAEIASMRTKNDLERITPLIWNELTTLGVPFIRCGVFIMDDSHELIHTFLSTPDGKAIAAFHLPYNTPGNIANVLSHWHDKKNYIDHWDESAFTEFAGILVKQGDLASAEQYLKTIPRGGFYLHFLPFLQGMLYVGNTTQLGGEEIKLLQSVADAFSTAYARYEDFNKLEEAKGTVERTLSELKSTQSQLIQSEKMASLGELTAGIAHEIQNPLNFVNNFSEVNTELIEEMKEELEKGNLTDAKAIAKDIADNEQKINHHGKRADAIVKGMLQHSRSSSAIKEPTDINRLADEYLRLAYHGLRAKDKSFNATLKTDFEESIGNIHIIPQDIGRAVLNLITNAFYAVTEKKKQQSNGYEPTVSVSTKKTGNNVEVRVKDNGNGIPQKVLDKIFQPFFTTKPTGQGTGLGLSLAYDIITKGHGGELKVETKEREGTEFIIFLPTN